MKKALLTFVIIAAASLNATAENLFNTLLGKTDAEVENKLQQAWKHFFTPGDLSLYEADGQKSVYYETPDGMAFVMDTGSNDVRSEGGRSEGQTADLPGSNRQHRRLGAQLEFHPALHRRERQGGLLPIPSFRAQRHGPLENTSDGQGHRLFRRLSVAFPASRVACPSLLQGLPAVPGSKPSVA